MGVITSIYQGQLDIPMFLAPYSYTTPSYVSTVNQGNLNPWSDNPLAAEIYGIDASPNGLTSLSAVSSAYAVGLSYSGSAVFTVNGGYNSGAFLSQSTPLASLLKNKVTFGYAFYNNVLNSANYASYGQIAYQPFWGPTNAPSMYNSNPFKDYTLVDISNAPKNFQGTTKSPLPCVMYDSITSPTPVQTLGYLLLIGNPFYLAIVVPDLLYSNNPGTGVYPLQTNQQITGYNTAINFPIFVGPGGYPSNILWGFPTAAGAAINVMGWHSGLGGFGSLPAIDSIDTWQFDSAALNTVITNHAPYIVCSPCGLRGWLFSDIDHGVDYWVSRDGTKYWKLNYIPQGAAKPITSGSQAAAKYKFVDYNGVMWYTGLETQSGQTVTPQYSFGINIPFNRIALPVPPPFRMPCYSDCLSMGESFSKT